MGDPGSWEEKQDLGDVGQGFQKTRRCLDSLTVDVHTDRALQTPRPGLRVPGEPQLTSPAPAGHNQRRSSTPATPAAAGSLLMPPTRSLQPWGLCLAIRRPVMAFHPCMAFLPYISDLPGYASLESWLCPQSFFLPRV